MHSVPSTTVSAIGFALALFAAPIAAGEITGLTSFSAGTPARASEVNGNFAAVKTAVDDNAARIAALEAKVAALEAKLASLSVVTENGYPTVRFSGVNVQVVNGLGSTATANGTGNLIVGYNEPRPNGTTGQYRCTVGYDENTTSAVVDEPGCTAAGGTWTDGGFVTGSHYLVGGSQNSYSYWGGIVFGYRNTGSYRYAGATGGQYNIASGEYSGIAGGNNGKARGNTSTILGGYANTASGIYATVGGGSQNVASGSTSSVTSGAGNTASAPSSSVSGGVINTASGSFASVSGGQYNTASGSASSVTGGGGNTALLGNIADENYSAILGGTGQNTGSAVQTIPALP